MLYGGTYVLQPVPMPLDPLSRRVGITGMKNLGSTVMPSSSKCSNSESSDSVNNRRAIGINRVNIYRGEAKSLPPCALVPN
mmetsp:Transcript_8578/g.8503  ORF Transcript_8578/g.8503 Transcript_8578/m.8503 type:complete len:81 (+) Transcript_8578:789-1031(+)